MSPSAAHALAEIIDNVDDPVDPGLLVFKCDFKIEFAGALGWQIEEGLGNAAELQELGRCRPTWPRASLRRSRQRVATHRADRPPTPLARSKAGDSLHRLDAGFVRLCGPTSLIAQPDQLVSHLSQRLPLASETLSRSAQQHGCKPRDYARQQPWTVRATRGARDQTFSRKLFWSVGDQIETFGTASPYSTV